MSRLRREAVGIESRLRVGYSRSCALRRTLRVPPNTLALMRHAPPSSLVPRSPSGLVLPAQPQRNSDPCCNEQVMGLLQVHALRVGCSRSCALRRTLRVPPNTLALMRLKDMSVALHCRAKSCPPPKEVELSRILRMPPNSTVVLLSLGKRLSSHIYIKP